MSKHDFNFVTDKAISAESHDEYLSLYWQDGSVSRFHYQWLRDNCRSVERFDPATQERKALTETIPSDLRANAIRIGEDDIRITWSDGAADSHFYATWLKHNAYDVKANPSQSRQHQWGSEYASSLQSFGYKDVMADDVIAAAMVDAFEQWGLIRLTGAPTDDREVERFADRLAYVREIAFDRVANIKVSVDPYTLGFTNSSLPMHTDCSGYSWPPNVMVFHCMQNEVAGGASQYVDGAKVIAQLRKSNPDALRILTEHDVEFRLWSKQADTLSQYPPVMLDQAGDLALLRYANWTVQPLKTVPFDTVPRWYDAWRALAERVNAPENRLSHRCEPGEMLLINNHRVLHGRDAFDDGEGIRHFQQVYMELDDLSGFRRIVQGEGGVK
jgi:gamma-butyrobetaine dioxygenase